MCGSCGNYPNINKFKTLPMSKKITTALLELRDAVHILVHYLPENEDKWHLKETLETFATDLLKAEPEPDEFLTWLNTIIAFSSTDLFIGSQCEKMQIKMLEQVRERYCVITKQNIDGTKRI